MREIEFDYNKIAKNAGELEELSARAKNIAGKEISESLTAISGSWESEGASVFLTNADKLKNDIEKTAVKIEKIAYEIRNKAKRLYDAEMEAEKIAETRTAE